MRPPPSTDPLAVRFAEGAAPPSGCFGLSRKTGAVACLVGQYKVASEWGERHVSILSSSEEPTPDIPIRVQLTEAGLKLETSSQHALDAIMLDGDFITLRPPIIVPVDTPRAFGGLLIELRREEVGPTPDGYWDLRVVVRADTEEEDASSSAGGANVLLANTLTSVACIAPTLAVRMLEPKIVLIERECRVDDSGQAEVMLGAWLCDSDRARCD